MIRKRIYKLRYILVILSALLGLLGLSSSFWAYWGDPFYMRQIWTLGYSPYSQSYDITVLKSWLPLTSALWITKNMFYFHDWYYWWRETNGLPYVYQRNDCQWFVKTYKVCDSMTWSYEGINNCSSDINIWVWTAEIFRTFFENVSNSDYFAFHRWGADYWTTWDFYISSDSLGDSIWRSVSNCNLTWSLNYQDISFDSFQNSMWDNSPWGLPSGWGGWTIVNTTSDLTNSQVVSALWSYGFSKNICYGGVSASADYSSAIPWTWKTLFQLYNEFNPNNISNVVDRYAYYKEWYIDYPQFTYSWGAYITDPHSPFLSGWSFMLSVYRLFLFGDRYWVSFYPASDIVEYCDLLLNKNPDSIYTWDDWSQVVWGAPIIDYYQSLYNLLWGDPQQIYDTWAIASLSWENLTRNSKEFFENLSNKFSSSLDKIDSWIVGVIPNYILLFMFALILIRMISK